MRGATWRLSVFGRALLPVLVGGSLLLPGPGAAEGTGNLPAPAHGPRVQAGPHLPDREAAYARAAKALANALESLPVDSPLALDVVHALRCSCEATGAGPQFVAAVSRFLSRVEESAADTPALRKLRCDLRGALVSHHETHGEFGAAAERCEELRKCSPAGKVTEVEDRLIGLHVKAGHLEKALGIVEKKRAAGRLNGSQRRRAALLCFRLGKMREGLSHLGKPESPHTVRNAARQLLKAGLLRETEEVIRNLAKTDLEAKFLLAQVRSEQKRFGEARELLEKCFTQARAEAGITTSIARKLAALHSARNTVAEAVRTREEELQAVSRSDGGRSRKLLLLLCELEKSRENFTRACEHYLDRRELSEKESPREWALVGLGRGAVRQCLQADQPARALRLIRFTRVKGIRDYWLDCGEYVALQAMGREAEAETKLATLEPRLTASPRELSGFMDELNKWGRPELTVRYARRVLSVAAGDSPQAMCAHLRLGDDCRNRDDYAEAQKHYDAVAGIAERKGYALHPLDDFGYLEAEIRFRRAGRDPEVLLGLLTDERAHRRLGAVRLLAWHGKPEQIPELRSRTVGADAKLRAAVGAAIDSILGRSNASSTVELGPGSDDLRTALAGKGDLLWIQEDPYDPETQWAAIKGKFVARVGLEGRSVTSFHDEMDLLCEHPLNAKCVAFTNGAVWIGTDHGLFAFDRERKSWSAYVINGRHHGVPVTEIHAAENSVFGQVETGDGPVNFSYDPGKGEWRPGVR